MKKPLNKNPIRQFYSAKKLSDDSLEKLINATESGVVHEKKSNYSFKSIHAFAAGIIVSLMLGMFLSWSDMFNTQSLANRVTKEIAMNHNKHEEVAFLAQDLAQLNAVMKKLDFNLILSNAIKEMPVKLVGARYCSIQGNIAAQLKYQLADGQYITLYQTKLDEALSLLNSGKLLIDSTNVAYWHEQGVFIGLAQ